jgi:thiamine pyrophosphate-dependent acetolactate synthase large subunit-like protein
VKLYEALADAFKQEHTEHCFALLGDANMHWAGALAERDVQFIYTRHEHAAVAGATAYARAKGVVGVATVTCGPGLTQVMTILPIAVRARIPLVIFAGEAPLQKSWYNQGIDHAPFVNACGAQYRALHQPAAMISEVHCAFADARRMQQPIVIGVPFDLQQQIFDKSSTPGVTPVQRKTVTTPPDAQLITEAAAWLNDASKPVVLAGLGAASPRAAAACITLAEKSGACLATTLPAKGLFHDQPFCLGVAGGFATEDAKAIFAQCDLIIAIGARLAAHTFDGGKLAPAARVIHIDLNPQSAVQGRKASDLKITADATAGATALTNAVTSQTRWRTEAMARCSREALMMPDHHVTPDGLLHPMAVVKQLAEVIPHHCHVINTSGHSAYYTAQMNSHPQSHYTVIRDFGAIGNGTSFAMGVATAHPDRPIVLIDGDGSALMHIQELETMHRHNMKILVMVLNDGAYGSEVHKLRANGVTDEGSVFGRPDFAGIGQGFGLHGKTFIALDNMAQAMTEFLNGNTSMIWDIHISDQIASPQILKAHQATHNTARE